MISNTRAALSRCLSMVLMAMILSTPSRADPQILPTHYDFGGDYAYFAGFLLVTDVSLTVVDLINANKGPPPRGYAIAEIIIALPLALLGAVGTIIALNRDATGGAALFGILTLWPLGLTIHGITNLRDDRARFEAEFSDVKIETAAALDRVLIRPGILTSQTGPAPGLSFSFRF